MARTKQGIFFVVTVEHIHVSRLTTNGFLSALAAYLPAVLQVASDRHVVGTVHFELVID